LVKLDLQQHGKPTGIIQLCVTDAVTVVLQTYC